jgi:hypothetical protein
MNGMRAKELLGKIWHFSAGRFIPPAASFRRRRGQNTVEYLLMLASTSAAAVILIASFHKKILGGIFTIAGLIIGAGTPK